MARRYPNLHSTGNLTSQDLVTDWKSADLKFLQATE